MEGMKDICQPQVSFLPTILAIPQFLIKGFPPKEDPKLSFEGNKVHTLLKLFQGESSKQDSVKCDPTKPRISGETFHFNFPSQYFGLGVM